MQKRNAAMSEAIPEAAQVHASKLFFLAKRRHRFPVDKYSPFISGPDGSRYTAVHYRRVVFDRPQLHRSATLSV